MENFKDVEKLSKKEKKEYYSKYRRGWSINPIARFNNDKKFKRHKMEEEICSSMVNQYQEEE
jgi:hypothetical protein